VSDIPEWLRMPPGAGEAATALVVDGNPEPAREWLEQTQDIDPSRVMPEGVWRADATRNWFRAPEMSERAP